MDKHANYKKKAISSSFASTNHKVRDITTFILATVRLKIVARASWSGF